MHAVVKIGGHQYRVQKGDQVLVDRQAGNPGDALAFDQVLMLGDGEAIKAKPADLSGASVKATIKEQLLAPKVRIFKYKRRKGYKRTRGHRQPQTILEISAINA